jgi:hypothetical protein
MAAANRRLLRSVALAGALGVGPHAHAGDKPTSPDPAEVFFGSGVAAFNSGRTADACILFEQSLAVEVRGGTLLASARCHEELGKYVLSYDEYTRALEFAQKANRRDRIAEANDGLARVAKRVGRLKLEVPAGHPVEEIWLGGERLPRPQWNTFVVVPPNKQLTVLFEPQHERSVVSLGPGETLELSAPAFEAKATDSKASGSGLGGLGIAGIVLGSVGLLSFGGAIGFGVAANNQLALSDEHCDLTRDPVTCDAIGVQAFDDGQSLAAGADILLTLGIVSTSVGLALFIVERVDSPPVQLSLEPVLSPSHAGLRLRSVF